MPMQIALQALQLREGIYSARRRRQDEVWQDQERGFRAEEMDLKRQLNVGTLNDHDFNERTRQVRERAGELKLQKIVRQDTLDIVKLENQLENMPKTQEVERQEMKTRISTAQRVNHGDKIAVIKSMESELEKNIGTLPPETVKTMRLIIADLRNKAVASARGMLTDAAHPESDRTPARIEAGYDRQLGRVVRDGRPLGDVAAFGEAVASVNIASADPDVYHSVMLNMPTPKSMATNWVFNGKKPESVPPDTGADAIELDQAQMEIIVGLSSRAAALYNHYSQEGHSVEIRRDMAFSRVMEDWGGEGVSDNGKYLLAREVAERLTDFVEGDVQRAVAQVVADDDQQIAAAFTGALEGLLPQMVEADPQAQVEEIMDSIGDPGRLAALFEIPGDIDNFAIADMYGETGRKELEQLIKDGKGSSGDARQLYVSGILNTIGARIASSNNPDKEDALLAFSNIENQFRQGSEIEGLPGELIGMLEQRYAELLPGMEEQKNILSANQQMSDDRELAHNGNWQVWGEDGKVAFRVDSDLDAVGQAFMQLAAGMAGVEFGEFGGGDEFVKWMDKNDVFLFRPDVQGGYSQDNIVHSIANLPSQIAGASTALRDYANAIRKTASPSVLARIRQQSERFDNFASVLPNAGAVLEHAINTVGAKAELGRDDVRTTDEYKDRSQFAKDFLRLDVFAPDTGDRRRLQFEAEGTRVTIEPPSLSAIREMRGLSRSQRAAIEDVFFHDWNRTVETLMESEAGRKALADPAGRAQFEEALVAQAVEAEHNFRSLAVNLDKLNQHSHDVAQNATLPDNREVGARAYQATILMHQAMEAMGIKPYNENDRTRYDISAPVAETLAGF